MYDTFLINGTDIKVAGVRQVVDLSGAYSTAPLRAGQVVFPGRDGEAFLSRSFDAGSLTLGLVLLASGFAGFNDTYRTLRRLVAPGTQLTLTRRAAFATGNEDHTAKADYLSGLEPAVTAAGQVGRLALAFRLLEGLWYGPSATLGTGSVTALGDTRTHRMTITLSAGTNPTLTNSVTGHSLTYTGSTSTAVAIDVEAMTATQGSTDVSANLTWTKTFPFRLNPGTQTVTCSSGSASISYQPAYL
ncbi:MAG: phage distal tail protein [Blastococcus sp.]